VRHWIFQANPKRFDIERRLRDPNPATTWLVTRYKHEIGPGDHAFIWKSGERRGILAIMRIDSYPAEMVEAPEDRPYWTDRADARLAFRVRGVFVDRFPLVPVERILAVPGLRNLLILTVPQGTNFPLTEDEAELLAELMPRLDRARVR
jgi:hypothetical protein